MIHGGRSPVRARRMDAGSFGVRGPVAFLFVLAMALVAGCGGGSSSGGSNNGGGGGTKSAAVTGRVVDQYNNSQPLAGAAVMVGSLGSGTTAADGTFSIPVVPNGGAQNLTVNGPTGVGIYDYANVSGTIYRVRSVGIPVPALSVNQNYQVGDIVVLSDTGPPPPPSF
jgi:hypothetical protein